MPFAHFREGKINYRVKGKGRAIVLLHGFLGSFQIWENILPELSKRYKVVLIDLPGHGNTDNFGYVHKMDLMAEAVKAVLNQLQLRRYVIIGHSMGGYVTMAFAEKYMDNLRGVVLFHSTALADSDEKKADRDKAIKVAKKNKEKYLKESVKKLFLPSNVKKKPEIFQKAVSIANETSVQGIVAAIEGMKQRRNTEVVLQFCHCPVMFIAGLHDLLLPLELHQHQFDLPQEHQLLLLEHSAHMGFYEEPEFVLKGLLPFLRNCFGPLEE
ncbi:MAG TPA: alpha/beta hydrolase [Bacteroidia bacterium]|nr:alpha/beta hydrolase [Bacteroidia bacterium]